MCFLAIVLDLVYKNSFDINPILYPIGGGQPWTMSSYLEPDPRARDVAFLDQYATERWETVLHYMVASSQQGGISADAVRTLLQVQGVTHIN